MSVPISLKLADAVMCEKYSVAIFFFNRLLTNQNRDDVILPRLCYFSPQAVCVYQIKLVGRHLDTRNDNHDF